MVGLSLTELCRKVGDHSDGRVQGEILGSLAGDSTAESGDVRVTGIADSSDIVRPGDLFVCIAGQHHDGHDFAEAAVQAGAHALLVQRRLDTPCPQVRVPDTRTAIGEFAAAIFDYPSESMKVIGITGTNGKTTTAHLIAAIASAAGHSVRILGTLTGTLTTPEAVTLQAQLATWQADGCDLVVMEVSSHALALYRVDGIKFGLAVFTNLGRDHLDLHQSMEAYFRAKARLFTKDLSAQAVVNTADIHGALLADSVDIPVTPVNHDRLRNVSVSAGEITGVWADAPISVPLGGHANVENLLVALQVAEVLGISPSVAASGLAEMSGIPGRFEVVVGPEHGSANSATVIVDFAHTPEGLEDLLKSVRKLDGCDQVLVVFGCGGDRDREKRPRMGLVAMTGADSVIVTSDNPRSEDPAAIADAVLSGIEQSDRSRVRVELDRRSAIRAAISAAGPHDVVVIAGKGHENTQIIGDVAVPFSDVEVVREILGPQQGSQR